jgi:hypothetical protein
MAGEAAAGQRPRIAEPAVEKEYSVAAVTARIDDLYEQLASRGKLRTMWRGRTASPAIASPATASPATAGPATGESTR